MGTAALAAQLDEPFDTGRPASAAPTGCSAARRPHAPPRWWARAPTSCSSPQRRRLHGWPSRAAARVVLRDGAATQGQAPAHWIATDTTPHRNSPCCTATSRPHRFLPYLSWTEIDALPDRENTVIVLPGRRDRAARPAPALLGRQRDLLRRDGQGAGEAAAPRCAPSACAPITYGKSDEHLHFPGTMTLTGTTLLATVIEIGESVYRSGFRKLLFANGHGGQPQVLEMAARELRLRHGDFVIVPHRRLAPAQRLGQADQRAGEEAGDARRPFRDRADAGAGARHGAHGARGGQLPAGVPDPSCCRPTAARPAPGPRATSAPAA